MPVSEKKKASAKMYYRTNKAKINDKRREWRANHPDRMREQGARALSYKAARLRETKRAAKHFFIMMKGGECIDCGLRNAHPAVYDFDHRDPSEKLFEIGTPTVSVRSVKILEELAKCDLVCANCHRIRTAKY